MGTGGTNYGRGATHGIRLRERSEYLKFLEDLKKGCGSESTILDSIGEVAVGMIRKRALSGRDVDGVPFEKYDKTYARRKGQRRRNLSSTGDPTQGMLGAITHKKGVFSVIIFVRKNLAENGYGGKNNKYIIAEVHNFGMISGRRSRGRFKMPRSHFFGLNGTEEKKLYKIAYNNFHEQMVIARRKWDSGGY